MQWLFFFCILAIACYVLVLCKYSILFCEHMSIYMHIHSVVRWYGGGEFVNRKK